MTKPTRPASQDGEPAQWNRPKPRSAARSATPTAAVGMMSRTATASTTNMPRFAGQRFTRPTVQGRRGAKSSHAVMRANTPAKAARRIVSSLQTTMRNRSLRWQIIAETPAGASPSLPVISAPVKTARGVDLESRGGRCRRGKGAAQRMDIFVQQLINGITLGSIYGLIAIGYTMVFGIIGMVNFAHGDVFMVSAFIALVAFLILVSFLGISSIAIALFIVLIVADRKSTRLNSSHMS